MNEQRPADPSPTGARDHVEDVVRQALGDVAPEADLATLDPSAPVQEALDLDSMDFLTFVTAVHEATGVDIPERDYPAVASLDSCVAYVTERLP